MSRLRRALVVLAFVVFAISTQAQPQLARDYVRGPGGKLAVTIEPDNNPPSAPSSCSAAQSGACAIDGIDVWWDVACDIGSGVAGYNGPGGYTTGFGYHDSDVQGGQCYSYSVTAVDNAGLEGDPAWSNTVCIELCMDARWRGLFMPDHGPQRRRRGPPVQFLNVGAEYGLIVHRRVTPFFRLIEIPKIQAFSWQPQPQSRAVAAGAGGGQ